MSTPERIDETRVHRALGDPSRVRILEILRGADRPLDATELAERVGLHANTIRSHLRILSEARLVAARPEERTRPGRPRLVYGPTPEGVTQEERAGYRLLAEILASYLAGPAKDSSEQAEAAGRAWGRYLVDRRPPVATDSDEDDVAEMVRLLDEFGFDPQLERAESGLTGAHAALPVRRGGRQLPQGRLFRPPRIDAGRARRARRARRGGRARAVRTPWGVRRPPRAGRHAGVGPDISGPTRDSTLRLTRA